MDLVSGDGPGDYRAKADHGMLANDRPWADRGSRRDPGSVLHLYGLRNQTKSRIGPVMVPRAKVDRLGDADMFTSATGAKLSIQQSSPIQQWSPIFSFRGTSRAPPA